MTAKLALTNRMNRNEKSFKQEFDLHQIHLRDYLRLQESTRLTIIFYGFLCFFHLLLDYFQDYSKILLEFLLNNFLNRFWNKKTF